VVKGNQLLQLPYGKKEVEEGKYLMTTSFLLDFGDVGQIARTLQISKKKKKKKASRKIAHLLNLHLLASSTQKMSFPSRIPNKDGDEDFLVLGEEQRCFHS
jgi:hypothetical protein